MHDSRAPASPSYNELVELFLLGAAQRIDVRHKCVSQLLHLQQCGCTESATFADILPPVLTKSGPLQQTSGSQHVLGK